MFLYDKIKECRADMNFSGEDLVIALSNYGLRISRQTLSSWENGETAPNAEQLSQLVMFFDKPISYFFDHKMKQNVSVDTPGHSRA